MTTHHLHASPLSRRPAPMRGELSALMDLLPSSLDLLSAGLLARQGFELISNATNGRRFLSALARVQSRLREGSIPVLVSETREAPELLDHESLSRSQRRWIGQVALELYFTQLLRSEVSIIDVWPSRFGIDSRGDAVWAPRPFYVRWDRRFRDGLRDVYAGFFLDDRERFDLGVFELGLETTADALLGHLGGDNQRSVRFGDAELRDTLSAMANGRRGGTARLHPNFVAFGLHLVALHQLLGSLDTAFDVRAAFMRSYPGSSHR